jgi:hypothetical protein
MDENEPKFDSAVDQNLVEKRLARITELLGKSNKIEAENTELHNLMVEQKEYERLIYPSSVKVKSLSEEEKSELRQLRKKQFSGNDLVDAETKRIVELSQREDGGITHQEEFRTDPLSGEEKNELRRLRVKQYSGGLLTDIESKRIVELSKREKVTN